MCKEILVVAATGDSKFDSFCISGFGCKACSGFGDTSIKQSSTFFHRYPSLGSDSCLQSIIIFIIRRFLQPSLHRLRFYALICLHSIGAVQCL